MDADAVGVPERRLSRITPLLALLGGLTLATSASAEGAWVLWLGTGTTYTPFGAYGGVSGERECKESIAQLMTEMRKNSTQLSEFLKSSSRYICLPDTVDPRAPKGK
jgi:hypothetical protein